MTTIKILLVEDNPVDVRHIKKILKDVTAFHSAVTNTTSLKTTIEALAKPRFDIILLDLSIKESKGKEIFTAVRQRCGAIPVVLIAGSPEERTARTLIRKGAQDYITKSSLSAPLLQKTIQYSIERSAPGISASRKIEHQTIGYEQLQENELKYRLLFDRMMNGFALHEIICDNKGNPVDYRFLEVNRAFEEMTTLESSSIIGKTVKEIMPDIEPYWIETYGTVALTGKSIQFEQYSRGLDKYFSVAAFSPQPNRFATIFEDITRIKQDGIKIQKLIRINRMLSNINQLIVRTKDIQTVYREACSIAVHDGKFIMAWIGLRNAETDTLDVVAHAGITDDYLKKINIDFKDPVRSSGPTGLTVSTGKHQVIADIETDPAMEPWRTDAVRIGYKSSAAFPITVNGRIVGAFTLYAAEKNFFSDEELELLDELAMDISFAMEVKEIEQERHMIYDALQKSETIFSQFMEHSPVYVFFKDDQMRSLRLSKNYESMLGRPLDELLGKTMDELFPSDLAKKMIADDKQILNAGKQIEIEEELNGRTYYTIKFPIHHKETMRFLAGYTLDITDRKMTEAALRNSEVRYRRLFEAAKEGILILDAETGIIIDVNPFLINLLESASGELCGKHLWEAIEFKNIAASKDKFSELMQKEYSRYDDLSLITKSGRKIEIEFVSNLYLADSHKVIQCNIRDISERKHIERKLRESEEQLQFALSGTNDGIWDVRLDTGEVYLSPRGCEILEYTSDELHKVAEQWQQLVHPDDLSATNDALNAYLKGRTPLFIVEQRLKTKSGNWKWILTRGKSVSNNIHNNPIRMVGTHTDISERKSVENKLAVSEKKFRWLFDYAPTAYHVLTPEGNITNVNVQWCKLLGYTEQEVLGKEIFDFVIENERNASKASFTEKIKSKKKLKNVDERTFVAKDGTAKTFIIRDYFSTDEKHAVTSVQTTMEDITERKRSDQALRESEERLRLSLKAANQGLYDLNVQTGEAIVNDEYASMLGYEPAAFVETNAFWIERCHPEDRERAAQTYADYINGKLDEYKVEFRQKTRTGEWKWILSVGKVIEYTKDGQPLRMLGTHTDIDQMKRAEEIRRLQTTALEAAANGIVITDIKGQIVWVNNAFSKITGYSAQEAIGGKPNLLKSGKHTREFYEDLWKTIISGDIWHGNVINKKKNGTLYDDEMTITPVRDEQNAITHFIAIKQDVTSRNRAFEQIELQAQLLGEAHDAIILRDMDHRILFWNKGAEKIYGWTLNEVFGKDIREVLFRNSEGYQMQFTELEQIGELNGEFRHFTKGNKEIVVDMRMSVMKDAQGDPKGVISINSDITEKKHLESQLLRTQRLESLGTLAGGIAHDLNNVLAPILLSIELLKRLYPTDTDNKILSAIESSAKRGAEIVKQILGFARGLETKKTLIESRHLINEIVSVFKVTFPRSITFVNEIPKDTWTILGDPTHFHQMIMNLGVNARDAMPNGGTLTITAENVTIDQQYARMNIQARPGNFVKFSISDTGIGMTAEIIDHIFEPFFTTKEIGKGTGLGLSTVHTIVKSHDGFVEVESEPGKGSTFHVFLPASTASGIDSGNTNIKETFIGNGETILIVDDESSVIEVTKQTLEAFNYSVITASEGTEAIAKYAEHAGDIALVITDMMMPTMDGHQLIIALRKMNPHIKIIASSGLIDKRQSGEAAAIEVNGVLHKPYTAERMMQIVQEVLRGET